MLARTLAVREVAAYIVDRGRTLDYALELRKAFGCSNW